MRVLVKSVMQLPSPETTVNFVCELGAASARWVGSRPEEGVAYDVEIEIPGVLKWGTDICATEKSKPEIVQRGMETLLVGRLEAWGGDGVARVQLRDAFVLVEVDAVACQLPCDVLVKTVDLRLFDVNT